MSSKVVVANICVDDMLTFQMFANMMEEIHLLSTVEQGGRCQYLC